MRIFRPSDAPTWLAQVLTSIENLFRQVMPAPFSLWRSPTADLPAAADYTGALVWDETTSLLSWSNGSAWVSPSLSSHVHAASAITFAPAGGIAAVNVQAAIVELDTEKAAAAHTHAIADVTGLQAALDAKLDDTQASVFGLSLLDDTDATAARATLGLVIGTNVQAYSANLLALGGVTSAADKLPYFTGAGTAGTTDLSGVARTLIGQTTQALMRTAGLGLGTAATQNTGTSGTTIPLLDGANTWSGLQTLSGGTGMTGGWNRSLLLDANFPTLVLRSNWPATATEYAAIGYDGTVDTMFFFVGATTSDATVATAKTFQISPTGIGYATGTGGTVTQATSKSTGVTLNKTNGSITLNAAALAASTSVAFTLTNSTIAATDVVNVTIRSGATSGAYVITVQATAAGSCSIMVRNVSAGSLSEALVLNFAVLKAVTS